MYRVELFHTWVPSTIQTVLLFLLALPLLGASSIYTSNIGVMYAGLGGLAETLSFANYASTIGMMIGIGLVLKVKPYFKSKVTVVLAFIMLGILSLVIGYTDHPMIIILSSLLMGFIKIFGMIELLRPIMLIISPKGDRGEFYAVFYPLVISFGLFSGYVMALVSYRSDWRLPYTISAAVLFACALLCIILMHNKRTSKREAIKRIDLLGVILFVSACLLLNYILVYAKQQGWFLASRHLKMALLSFVAVTALFIRRQLIVAEPFLPLDVFRKRSVLTAVILFSLLGLFLATSSLQSGFTTILRYDVPTNALLNLAMVPGIVTGGIIAWFWFKHKWSIRILLLIAYGSFLIYTIFLYFLIAPVIEINYLFIPNFLKGLGMSLVYIGGGFYFASMLSPLQLMGAYPLIIGIRSFIGTAFFSAVLSWELYQVQWNNIADLSSRMDAINLWIQSNDIDLQLYSRVQMQATLMGIKQVFGYVALGGILVLVYIAVHPFYRLRHRNLILVRKRVSGQSTKGYRTDDFDDNDMTATSVSVST